jgi:hypothetical protein
MVFPHAAFDVPTNGSPRMKRNQESKKPAMVSGLVGGFLASRFFFAGRKLTGKNRSGSIQI